MCGFAGFYTYEDNLKIEKENVLNSMGNQIAHRGPDEEQLLIDGKLGLIFKRLSIVDISGGKQPIENEDKSLALVVNGEIFNYKDLINLLKEKHSFKTKSDCEVLVHLYEEKGIDFLKYINGMFAIALWDKKKDLLLLARDRLGIKPLYYSNSSSRILFGSEIKSLLPFPDCPRSFNWIQALDTNKKFIVDDNYEVETYFKGINQLRGGQYLTVSGSSNTFSINSYWSLMNMAGVVRTDSKKAEHFIDEYYSLLSDSVNRMLLGDVEIGLFLSGGIDSSAIASLDKSKRLKTFSVLNNDTLENGDSFFGNKVANFLGMENYQVNIVYEPRYHTSMYWKNLVWQCETYECGTEQLFKFELYRFVKENFPSVRVMLLGQGSDEFNGGYVHNYINVKNPEDRNMWDAFEIELHRIVQTIQFSGKNTGILKYKDIVKREFVDNISKTTANKHPWYNFLNMHSKNLQIYQLLHEDRTAMGNSIENRVPFLDHRLVELILSIPPILFKELFWNKNILRRAMENNLSPIFCSRRKVPFVFNNKNNYSRKIIYDILTRNNSELISYAFGEKGSRHDVIDRNKIDHLIAKANSENDYNGIDDLRFLVNMGILSRMAEQIPTQRNKDTQEKISLPIKSFCNQKRYEQKQLMSRVKAYDKIILLNKVNENLYLSPNVQLLTDMEGAWFVFLKESLIEIELADNLLIGRWMQVLRHSKTLKNNVTQSIIDLDMTSNDFTNLIQKYLSNKIIHRHKKKKENE